MAQPTDRNYWEVQPSTKETMKLVDQITQLAQSFDPTLQVSYNKHYIGLWLNGSVYNFAVMRPRRSVMIFELKTLQEQMQNITNEVLSEDSELDIMEYDRCWGRSRIRLTATDLNKNQEILTRLLEETYELRK